MMVEASIGLFCHLESDFLDKNLSEPASSIRLCAYIDDWISIRYERFGKAPRAKEMLVILTSKYLVFRSIIMRANNSSEPRSP